LMRVSEAYRLVRHVRESVDHDAVGVTRSDHYD
jgi:hypothetical protein